MLSINALSPSSMDSGYSGSLNNMSPTNDNILYEIQIQQGHVNPLTPISIQTNSSPINTNVLSPTSSETSSASSVHYTNLNGKRCYLSHLGDFQQSLRKFTINRLFTRRKPQKSPKRFYVQHDVCWSNFVMVTVGQDSIVFCVYLFKILVCLYFWKKKTISRGKNITFIKSRVFVWLTPIVLYVDVLCIFQFNGKIYLSVETWLCYNSLVILLETVNCGLHLKGVHKYRQLLYWLFPRSD